jgi:hypothetical protein
MIRSQRRRHALTWLVLGPALILLLIAAIAGRPPAPDASERTATAP